jgi:hypothetical protein
MKRLEKRLTVAAKLRPMTDLDTFDYICETPKPGTPIRLGAFTVSLNRGLGRSTFH